MALLTQLRLPAFKSVRDGRVDLSGLTIVAGRNGSGKSNVIDALAVLAALASGAPLRDALDGSRDGPVVRGGSQGCAPLGSDRFEIGCSAMLADETVHLDLVVRTSPAPQIESERLWTARGAKARDYLRTDEADPSSGDITARWHSGRRGRNPPLAMRADRLLTTQVATRVPATTKAGLRIHEVAQGMLEAIGGTFILDPVPQQMREYVPERDHRLRRSADNLSATLGRLIRDESTRALLLEMTSALSEAQVCDLTTVTSELGDVMVTIEELIGGTRHPVPARLMSDGTLRFLAVAAALLEAGPDDGRLLVVEEIENGLHPSQASLLVQRLKDAAAERGVRTLATTHSPTILDALTGSDHDHVVVTARDGDGWTTVGPVTEFPNYFQIASRGSLGDSAIHDRLRPVATDQQAVDAVLAGIF